MAGLRLDLRLAVRQLRKRPGVAAAVVLSLALGIGANAAIFSVVNALLIRPLPVRDAGELLTLAMVDGRSGDPRFFSYPEFRDYREQSGVFADMVAFYPAALGVSDAAGAELAWGLLVTANYFRFLGVEPARGRVFLPAEDGAAGAPPVAVLSHAYWQRRFGGDPDAVGKTVHLNGHAFTVAGIAARGFDGTGVLVRVDLWIPMAQITRAVPGKEDVLRSRGTHSFRVLARPMASKGLEETRAALELGTARLRQAYPATYEDLRAVAYPESQARPDPSAAGMVRLASSVFMALVAVVLGIAGVNVANLFLAQALERRRETAVRRALGAGRLRLVRLFLVESVLLALAGGAVGLLMAGWATQLLSRVRLPTDLPVAFDVGLDLRVVGFTLAVSLLAALVFGGVPAWAAARRDGFDALKAGGRGAGAGWGRGRLRHLLVALEVALAVVLLAVAGLFVRSLSTASALDLGLDPQQTLLASVSPGRHGYDEAAGRELYRRLAVRARALPGAESASLARYLPCDFYSGRTEVRAAGGETRSVLYNVVGPGYFRTVRSPVLHGRAFSGAEDAAAVVNETLARRLWPDRSPLGRRLETAAGSVEVVGVVEDATYVSFGEARRAYLYLPLAGHYRPQMTLHVRAAADPWALAAPIRELVRQLDPTLPVSGVTTMADHLYRGKALLPARLGAVASGIFGVLGLMLAAVGVYGTVSYSTSRRTHELGLRMALGARRRDLLRLVLRQGMAVVAVGLGAGLLVAYGAARSLSSLLYGLGARDWTTFASVALLLAGVAAAAIYGPARAASRLEPTVALREE